MKLSKSVFSVLVPFLMFAGAAPAIAANSATVDGALITKLNRYIKECGAPGADPKPKMAEFVTYLHGHGFKDAKLECGVSNFEGETPLLMINLADGGKIFVNYKGKKGYARVSDVIEDVKTPDGRKRQVIWPTPKKKNSK